MKQEPYPAVSLKVLLDRWTSVPFTTATPAFFPNDGPAKKPALAAVGHPGIRAVRAMRATKAARVRIPETLREDSRGPGQVSVFLRGGRNLRETTASEQ